METQNNISGSNVNIEQKIWQHELEIIIQENDFLLNLLVSLQNDHLFSTRHEEKIIIFFNYFQYFTQLIKHLKENLIIIEKEGLIEEKNISNSKIYAFREEINNLEKKFQTFKDNFKSFIFNINNHNRIHQTKVLC